MPSGSALTASPHCGATSNSKCRSTSICLSVSTWRFSSKLWMEMRVASLRQRCRTCRRRSTLRLSEKLWPSCVARACRLCLERNGQPKPTWVTCAPSLRHPDLVPNFAKRLAAALGLPFHMVIAKTDDRPEQKTMANSTQQARNIDGSLALNGQPVPHGPVILVDDMVDSRWTLTVAAWLLRKSGSGDVWPMALSQTGHDE